MKSSWRHRSNLVMESTSRSMSSGKRRSEDNLKFKGKVSKLEEPQRRRDKIEVRREQEALARASKVVEESSAKKYVPVVSDISDDNDEDTANISVISDEDDGDVPKLSKNVDVPKEKKTRRSKIPVSGNMTFSK